MTRDEFLTKMLEKGKVTQAQANRIKAKDSAKETYRKDKAKMNKSEIQGVLDTLLS